MSWRQKDGRFYFALIAPSLALLLGIIVWPFLNVFWLSLQSRHTLKPAGQFAGLQNFSATLADGRFWQAFWVDLIWTAGAVGLGALVGLWAALLLHQKLPLRNLARGLVIFPYVVPTVVAVLVWRYMFNDLYGVANHLLVSVGLKPSAWLSSPDTAMLSTIIVGVWKYFPFYVIALLARLQIIPLELYEAARIDGANVLQSFRFITLPSILPVLLLTMVLRVIWTFNKFDIIYLLTGGGPARATTTLPILVFNKTFVEYNMGQAAAMAVLMFAFLAVVGLVYLFLYERLGDADG